MKKVLDLTEASVRAKLEVEEGPLRNPWRWQSGRGETPVTQQIGEAAYQSRRFEAIRYLSDKGDWPSWIIFVDRLKAPSFVEVSDKTKTLQGRLP